MLFAFARQMDGEQASRRSSRSANGIQELEWALRKIAMALTRRTFALGIVGVTGLLAWKFRVLQVGSFLAAAAAKKLLHADPAPDFKTLSPEWQSLELARRYPHSQSRGVITYHPWYHQFRPSVAMQCLTKAAELGAGFIRLDIRWKDLVPDGKHVDDAAWNWYQSYLATGRDGCGLEPIVVLSNPPEAVLHWSVERRLEAWTSYVDEVARRLGRSCNFYQILNEPNNPVFRIFPAKTTPVAIAEAARVIRQYNTEAKTAINMLVDLPGWKSELEKLIEDYGSAIDIVGLDYYPGTWAISWDSVLSGWNRLADEMIAATRSETSPLHNRPLAILETGYSTNIRRWRDEKQQKAYFQDLKKVLERWNDQTGQKDLLFFGVHELTDSDSSAGLDPEAHFGLLTSESLEEKAGFNVVRQLFKGLG